MTRYSAKITEHFHDPRNNRAMTGADAVGVSSLDGRPPFITIYLRVQDARVQHATFQASGCGFLIACCSALTEWTAERSLDECRQFQPEHLIEALEGLPNDKTFCAHLAVGALRTALAELDRREINSTSSPNL